MKTLIIKYGTFLIIPFIIIGISFTLSSLKIREKSPVILVCLSSSKRMGNVFIPQNANIPIRKGIHLVLETATYEKIECVVTSITEETANKRIQVKLCSTKEMNGNSICNAYIITKDVLMLDLILQKVLNM